ncbi:hypothetical protein HDU67_002580 [Dinochytrium kinnereticum]|nr:hypothetical protein HDU67_002580 [Dinochytrium kinnereticum]
MALSYVGKVVSTVADFYGGINPATLSGAIDIVVVERKDGQLHCSPFHVRFGKLKLLRPIEKKVSISINGKLTEFEMKVGEAGEAFFVVETDDPVASEYATSPIPQPTTPPDELISDILDLGDSITLASGSPAAKAGGLASPSPSDGAIKEGTAQAFAPANRARSASERPLSDVFDGSFKVEREDEDDYPLSETDADPNAPRGFRTDIHAERSLYNSSPVPGGSPSNEWSWTWGGLPVKAEEALDATLQQDGEIAEGGDPLGLIKDGQASSTYPVSPTQVSSLSAAIKATATERQAITTNPLTVTEKVDSFLASLPEDSSPLAKIPKVNVSSDDNPVKPMTVELSLCGKSAVLPFLNQGKEVMKTVTPEQRQHVETQFTNFLITFDSFSIDPLILQHPDLIVRIDGMGYYDWNAASVLLVSVWAFGRIPSPLGKVPDRGVTGPSLEPKKYSSFSEGLRQWWSRGAGSSADGIDSLSTSPTKPPGLSTSPTLSSVTPAAPSAEKKLAAPPVEQVKPRRRQAFAKTLRLTSDQLKKLDLRKGVNTVTFSVTSTLQGTASCTSKIFFWDYDVKVVISDVDGTITKSDALGHLFTMVGRDWTHSGVASLYTNIRKNGYQILYLTSRAIGQYSTTRDYLMKIEQNSCQLPDGPVIMSPDRLFTALHREVIQRKPEIFKIAALRDVKNLFGDKTPFYAGFGNRITDALAYRAVHVPPSRIFTIDPTGEVKLELLSSYKSSYVKLNDIVDQIFPDVMKEISGGYGDFEYWRAPVGEVEVGGLEEEEEEDEEDEEEEEEEEEDDVEVSLETEGVHRVNGKPKSGGVDGGEGALGREVTDASNGKDATEDDGVSDEEEGGEKDDLAERVLEVRGEPF